MPLQRRCVRCLLLATLLLCAARAAAAQAPPADDGWQTDLDRHVLEQLTQVVDAGPLLVHVRPGGLPPEVLAADIAANRASFEELQGKLGLKYEGRIHVFLYRDDDDMRATTEGDADIAFSTGSRSIHQVHDFRGVHELTHVFALQFPGNADGAGPDLFLVEGLATAMAESDQGVPVHAWAAMYQRLGRLPELPALRADLMGAAPRGVHPYHVAASFVLYLVERFGIEAVKRWYENSTEAGLELGVTFPRLDRDWRRFLADLSVAPADAEHVTRRFARGKDPLPEAWRTAAGTRLFDGGPLVALRPEDPSRWTVADGVLVGSHDGPWSALEGTDPAGADVGLRVRFRLREGDAFKLMLNHGDGAVSEAIFAAWASYMTLRDGHESEEEVKLPAGVWCEAIFANVGGRGRMFLNGSPVLDLEGALPVQPGTVGIAVERGTVEVADITVFAP